MVDTPNGPMDAEAYLATLGANPEEVEVPETDLGGEGAGEAPEPGDAGAEDVPYVDGAPEAPEDAAEAPLDLDIPETPEDSEGEAEGGDKPFGIETFNKYNDEFIQGGGTLSDESRADIMKTHNLSEEVLDIVLGGIQARLRENTQRVLGEVGMGADDFAAARDWSLANEPKDKQAERRSLLKNPDPSVRTLALRDLKAAYEAGVEGATPTPEPVHERGATPQSKKHTFASYQAEAMRNPLYKAPGPRGDVFRAKVTAALARLS